MLAGIGGEVTSSNTIFTYQNGGPDADVYVDYAPDLMLGPWVAIATNSAPTNVVNSVDHGVSGDEGFYRLRAERND